ARFSTPSVAVAYTLWTYLFSDRSNDESKRMGGASQRSRWPSSDSSSREDTRCPRSALIALALRYGLQATHDHKPTINRCERTAHRRSAIQLLGCLRSTCGAPVESTSGF